MTTTRKLAWLTFDGDRPVLMDQVPSGEPHKPLTILGGIDGGYILAVDSLHCAYALNLRAQNSALWVDGLGTGAFVKSDHSDHHLIRFSRAQPEKVSDRVVVSQADRHTFITTRAVTVSVDPMKVAARLYAVWGKARTMSIHNAASKVTLSPSGSDMIDLALVEILGTQQTLSFGRFQIGGIAYMAELRDENDGFSVVRLARIINRGLLEIKHVDHFGALTGQAVRAA